MQKEDLSFLQFFITEDIYVVPGGDSVPTGDIADSGETLSTQQQSVSTEATTEAETPDVKSAETQPEPILEQSPAVPETPVIPSVEEIKTEQPAYTPPVYEGHFMKKILIVVHTAGMEFEHKELLLKILAAINLNKEDVAILPSGHIKSKEEFDWMTGPDKRALIAFGLPDKWKDQILPGSNLYTLSQHQGYQLLFSENLTEISSNVNAKKQLWGALQQLQ